jgi:hypothetical protein
MCSLETITLPSEKDLGKCLYKQGFGHFVENSDFIENYANKEIYPSSIRTMVQSQLQYYTQTKKDTPFLIKYSKTRFDTHEVDLVIECILQDVPKDGLFRVRELITQCK